MTVEVSKVVVYDHSDLTFNFSLVVSHHSVLVLVSFHGGVSYEGLRHTVMQSVGHHQDCEKTTTMFS